MRPRIHLILLPFLTMFVGCQGGGDEGQARQGLKEKLDRWVAGDKGDHLVMPLDLAISEPPTSYEIKSFVSEHGQPSEGKGYQASVTLTFKSQSGSPLERVLRYHVQRDEKGEAWKVFEESREVFAH